mgnify:CR=1 FL=1
MFKLNTLTVRNFMSVGNQTQAVDFDRRDLTLVLGENLDQGGDDSGARNGTGKTTLFRLIRGELGLEGGSITLPRQAKIGGVAQEVPGNEVSLIDTVLAADLERANLLKESERATDAARISDIQTRLADIDAWSAEARASSILRGLGFDSEKQQMPCSAFSGGWRMRVALAAVLFSQPDVLLLDEPTNYLDLEGALWLENYLLKYPHTVLIVSHDRGLLNRSVSTILHLEDKKLQLYGGGYDTFAKTRAARLAAAESEAKKTRNPPRTFAILCGSISL